MEAKKPIVLVVDDDEILGRAYRRVFRRMNAEADFRIIDGPGCAGRALALARAERVTLVISDVDFGPDEPLDGIELCRILTGLAAPPRVVLMTGLTSPARSVAAMDAGAVAIEAKPFTDLVAYVRLHLAAALAWLAIPRINQA